MTWLQTIWYGNTGPSWDVMQVGVTAQSKQTDMNMPLEDTMHRQSMSLHGCNTHAEKASTSTTAAPLHIVLQLASQSKSTAAGESTEWHHHHLHQWGTNCGQQHMQVTRSAGHLVCG